MGGNRPNRPQEGAMLASTFRILALSALLAAAVMLTLTVPGA